MGQRRAAPGAGSDAPGLPPEAWICTTVRPSYDEFCIENDEFCIESDDFVEDTPRLARRRRLEQRACRSTRPVNGGGGHHRRLHRLLRRRGLRIPVPTLRNVYISHKLHQFTTVFWVYFVT